MRVGVEEALAQDLLVVRLEQLACRFLASWPFGRFADRDALDLLHDEQAGARELAVHGRAPSSREYGSSTPRIRSMFSASCRKSSSRLSDVGEVLDDRGNVDELPERRPVGRLLCEQLQQAEVPVDVRRGVRALHLHDHPVAALERRPVHLADRAGRERGRVDLLEDVLPGDAELLLHHGDDLCLRQRRDLLLERRELLDDLGREQVRARGEDLAELGERRPELLERVPQAARAGEVGQLVA